MTRGAKVAILVYVAIFASSFCFADEIHIPFAISRGTMIENAKKSGIDLSDGKDSDGFIKNEGMKAIIYTYRPFSVDELNIIKNIAPESKR